MTAGMFYGQYLSQYDVRRLLLKRGIDQSDQESQLLLGTNDVQCAKLLKLCYEQWEESYADV